MYILVGTDTETTQRTFDSNRMLNAIITYDLSLFINRKKDRGSQRRQHLMITLCHIRASQQATRGRDRHCEVIIDVKCDVTPMASRW